MLTHLSFRVHLN
uniref:Uncharacterized protein MANES_06G049900 n=1 Tax=Rhizophora mucronata TaxID=61149 RepID=A0A2P2K5N5_RHIMU